MKFFEQEILKHLKENSFIEANELIIKHHNIQFNKIFLKQIFEILYFAIINSDKNNNKIICVLLKSVLELCIIDINLFFEIINTIDSKYENLITFLLLTNKYSSIIFNLLLKNINVELDYSKRFFDNLLQNIEQYVYNKITLIENHDLENNYDMKKIRENLNEMSCIFCDITETIRYNQNIISSMPFLEKITNIYELIYNNNDMDMDSLNSEIEKQFIYYKNLYLQLLKNELYISNKKLEIQQKFINEFINISENIINNNILQNSIPNIITKQNLKKLLDDYTFSILNTKLDENNNEQQLCK